MTPEKKLGKLKYQKSLNITESFTKEEIKSLSNLYPEMNILFNSSSNKKSLSINNTFNLNSTYNNVFSPLMVSKKIFYKIILDEIQKHFLKERNNLMSKIISILMKEITFISKMIEENSILNKFISHLEKKKVLKKTKVLNLSLFDITMNKTENDIKNSFRTQSEKHYYSSFELNKNYPDNKKFIKGIAKINDKINKNLFEGYDLSDENLNKTKNKENGGNDKEIINYNNSKKIVNKPNIENENLITKSKKKFENYKKISNNTNFKENQKVKRKNYSNNNNIKNNFKLKSKGSINKRKNYFNNLETKVNEKENNIYKNPSKSISKRKIVFEQYNREEKKTINNSYTIKKSQNTFDNNNMISTNISIVKFLNDNSEILNTIETVNFDIFNLDEKIGKENTLSLIGYYIFNRFGFYNIINYNNFEKWCKKISEGYLRTNPYHTDLHAADITHTCLIYFKIGKINEICKLSKISKCSLFLSCICHDYKHPGVNNNFLKETKNVLSLTYNDTSILENMHISEAYKLINSNEEYNIFSNVDINVYKQIRKEMISCVLATDMTFHNFYVDYMKEQINLSNNKDDKNKNNTNDKDKENKNYQNYMNLLIHSADISNPTKPFEIYFKWAKLVVNEFYEQGDKEKKLGLTCSCDRNKVTLYQSQLGFINYIEIPFFSLFADLFKKLKFYYENLNQNKNKLIEMQKNEENSNKGINL